MKLIFLFSLLLSACSGIKTPPLFVKSEVCSQKSQDYINSHLLMPLPDPRLSRSLYLNLKPLVTACYEIESKDHPKERLFNLCMVAGINKNGKQDFFEFSTNESDLSPDFWHCINRLSHRLEFLDFKDTVLIHAFPLYSNLTKEIKP